MTSRSNTVFTSFDDGVEDFVLVVLDTRTAKTIEAEETYAEIAYRQSKFETIISSTCTFNDIQACRNFIESLKTEKVFLIACGYLGISFVPTVHSLQQIEVIYLFCIHEQKSSRWVKSHEKIRAVCKTTNELLNTLAHDVSMYAKQLTPLTIFSADVTKEISLHSLNIEEKRFMWFHLLLQVVLRMPSNENARIDILNECEQAYRGNNAELKRIGDFFQNYKPKNCVSWYTKDSFVYQLLNKACRTENIDTIFKFRFFIIDLHYRLKQFHQPFTDTFWRGQTMSNAQLEILKTSKDKLIAVNTFFSATKSFDRAIAFSGEGSGLPQLQSVVFQIEVHENTHDTQPFADITRFNSKLDDDEILFAMNTIFRLTKVEPYDNIWMIGLTLSDDGEQNFKKLVEHFKKEIDDEQMPPLLMMGELFWKMGDNRRAERYYQIMLRETVSNPELEGKIQNNIGVIVMKNSDLRQAAHYFKDALILQEPNETLDLAETYSNIASLHRMKNETIQAMDFNKKSLKIRLDLLPKDHPLIAVSYNNIGLVHFHRGEYKKALHFYDKACEIESNARGPSARFNYTMTLNNIGLVHFEQGQYELALRVYNEALTIRERSLPAQHPAFVESYNYIASVKEKLDQLDEALTILQKVLQVRLTAQLPEYHEIASCYNNIASMLGKLGRSSEALDHYFKALNNIRGSSSKAMRDKSLFLNNIGEQYRNDEDFVNAAKYHQEALRIRLKLFSRKKDPDLAVSYMNIGLLYVDEQKFDKALHFQLKALETYREIYQLEHPKTAMCFFKIGLLYYERCQYQTSLNYMQRALEIQIRVLPVGHDTIETTQQNISLVKKQLKLLSKKKK